MKLNKWTKGLAAAGVVSLASAVNATADANETVMTAVSSTTLSGYVSTTAIWKAGTGNGNAASSAPGFRPGGSFNGGSGSAQDSFSLDVVDLTISKPLDEGEWAAGYTAELWIGPDAALLGTTTGAPLAVAASDITIKQANVDLRIPVGNGLDLKMGVFDTIVGYESADIPENPNYTRNFGFFLEPFTHTGLLASYTINDVVSVAAGLANTYSPGVNTNPGRVGNVVDESEKTYLASIALTAPDSLGFLSGASLYTGIVDGLGTGISSKDTTLVYSGATLPTPLEGLAVGVGFDYRFNGTSGVATANGAPNSTWAWTVAGYVSYAATEKITVNYRADYANASDGTFYTRPAGDDEFHNKILSNTLTVDYKLWENVISRGEIRWDHALDGNKIYGGNATADQDRNSVIVALNVVYQF
jgi:hypothetical protein